MAKETTIILPTYFGNQMVQNSIESILKNVPNAQIYISKNDIGWLQACNDAMQKLNTDVILLNDDTYVISDIVTAMSDLAYSDPYIGIVGGKALAPNSETIINYGIYIAPDGNTAHRFYGHPRNSVSIEKQKSVEGSCMFIKREVIETIGLMDIAYGQGYRAEVDYCFMAKQAGYEIMSSPDAEYVHFTSQTMGRLGHTNDTYSYFMEKWGRKLKLGEI